MGKLVDKIKSTNWKDKFKEKKGRKGLLPWLSVSIQKWILVGLAFFGLLFTIISIHNGEFIPTGLVSLVICGASIFVMVKTKWLNDIENTAKPIKITGAALIVVGVLAILVVLGMLLFYLLLVILAILFIIVLFIIFIKALSSDEGEIKGKTGYTIHRTRIIRDKIFSEGHDLVDESGIKVGEITKAWFSDDQIIRDEGGREVGRIKKNMWNDDVQDICNEDGHKVGEIRTDIMGEREIVDESGNRVGIIDKDIWGETKIRD